MLSLRTEDFYYDLPPELIAQHPAEPRDSSRLMVLTSDGGLEHRIFRDLPQYLEPGDLLVLNRTRVLRARLFGHKSPTGGRAEVLLLRPAPSGRGSSLDSWGETWEWETLVRPGRRVPPGTELVFGSGEGSPGLSDAGQGARGPSVRPLLRGLVTGKTEAGGRTIRFSPATGGDSFGRIVETLGQVPLPPYITAPLSDPGRYQTIFATVQGSVAAPTAGLHFTSEVFARLEAGRVSRAEVTLHIGLDTFRPVKEERIEDHRMHREWYEVPPETARAVAECRDRGGRVVACGTTVVRTLEAAADPDRDGLVIPGSAETDLFIYPGYRFRVVDVILTNFHLPRSTLLMLISAFGGRERVLRAYEEAARLGYRFYSFGDAMLILPGSAAGEGVRN